MTIFSPQKFHQKAKNPRKRPIVTKFDVPKVPEVYTPPGEEKFFGEGGTRYFILFMLINKGIETILQQLWYENC